MHPMKNKVLILLYSLLTSFFFAQNKPSSRGFIKSNDLFGSRTFIENKGQFDRDLPGENTIEAVLDNGIEKIYFTTKGLVYKLVKRERLTEEQREAKERGEKVKVKADVTCYVRMNWQDANSKVVIEKKEKQEHYFTYGSPEYNSGAYKKLVYKNIYKHIDIEYTLPENKFCGIKYTVILHPGASVKDIRMVYSGDVQKLKRKANGTISIKTPIDEIIEFAPESFDEKGKKVESVFSIQNNTIGFDFPKGYDSTKTLVIDPYVVAVTSLTSTIFSNNQAFDVDYDNAGNAYIYGGSPDYKVARYSATGALQWIFSGVILTPVWSTTPGGFSFEGNFLVDRSTGKTYIGQGVNTVNNQIVRLNAAGNYDNFITAPNIQLQEVWDMGFRCPTNEVMVFGGCVPTAFSGATIDQITGAMTFSNFQPTMTTGNQDVVSYAIDNVGSIFVIYASFVSTGLDNKICAINSTFNGNLWTQPSTFTTLTEAGNKSSYVSYAGSASNGFNCLAVNANYLFYYDGLNLAAYNKGTGVMIASTTVPGQIVMRQGGIDVDDCNNLYLGGNGFILSYHFSGTAFSTLTSIPLNTGLTNPYAFDLKLDRVNKLLYVSGNSFVGTYSAINSVSCVVTSTPCYTGIGVQNYTVCNGATATITVPNGGGLSNPSYSILPGGVTNTTGVFPVTPSVTSTYTVFVTGINTFSVVQTSSAVSTVTVYAQPLLTPTVTQASCSNTLNAFNLGLTFSPSSGAPAYAINWTPTTPNGITSATQTVLNGGINPGTYTATVVSAVGCSATAAVVIDPVPPLPTFSIINVTGSNTLTCTSPSVVLTATTAYTQGALAYLWTSTNFTSTAQTLTLTSPGGIYTLQLSDTVNNCVSTGTYAVVNNISLTVSAANSGPICKGASINLNAVSAATSFSWNGPNGFTSTLTNAVINNAGLTAKGVYTVVAGLGSCTALATTTVFVADFLPVSIANTSNVCQGQTLSFTATAANSYAWTGPNNFNSILQSPMIQNVQMNASGIYTLQANSVGTYSLSSASSGTMICQSTLTTQASVNAIPVIAATNVSACVNHSFQLSASGGSSYSWAGPANFTSTIQSPLFNSAQPSMAGVYTITASNGGFCSAKAYVTVSVNAPPDKPIIVSNSPVCLTTSLQLSVNSVSGLSYNWRGPNYFSASSASVSIIASSSVKAGTYSLTVTNTANCTASNSINCVFLDLPQARILANEKGCGILCTTFSLQTSASNTVETWSFNEVIDESKAITVNKCFTQAGTYTVAAKIKDKNGCSNIAVNTIDVYPKPIADFSYSPAQPISSIDEFVTFKDASKGEGIMQWDWYFISKSSPKSTEQNPSYIYSEPGTYVITLVVNNQFGCADSVSKPLVVMDDFNIYVPNTFTPNDDGKNDVFMPKGTGIVQYELYVFSRWGEKIFYSSDIENGWDGRSGSGLEDFYAQGVYVWKINVKGVNQKTRELTGHVVLIR